MKKAVIWCEDQGNLAYYEAPQNVSRIDELFFDTGDYVEFDVEMDRDLCRASNAQVVVPVIAERALATRRTTDSVACDDGAPDLPSAPPQVIHFADHAKMAGHSAARFNRRG